MLTIRVVFKGFGCECASVRARRHNYRRRAQILIEPVIAVVGVCSSELVVDSTLLLDTVFVVGNRK